MGKHKEFKFIALDALKENFVLILKSLNLVNYYWYTHFQIRGGDGAYFNK